MGTFTKKLDLENPVRLETFDMNFDTNVVKFYAGQTVFITGVTGFIGKVFLEIILRKFPDLNTVYVLIRTYKNRNPKTRLQEILKLPLFDRLKIENPKAIEKIHIIEGDASLPKLGMSDENWELLQTEITLVFHVAASVRFDDPIKKAILLNTRGTLEMVKLCQNMKRLKCLTYVSTAYCNTDYDIIDEQVYPPKANWRKMIESMDTVDENILNLLTPFIMGELPNTYSFSKSLAESILDEYSSEIPIAIVRPSVGGYFYKEITKIVTCTYREPVAGWIDNFNGPMGMVLGVTKGVLHVIHGDKKVFADYVSVDLVIGTMLVSTMCRSNLSISKCMVINVTTSNVIKITNKNILELGLIMGKNYPLETVMWYPSCCFAKSTLIYYFLFFFLHIIPAIFVDLILERKGSPFRLMKVYRKVFFANFALKNYMMRNWVFQNSNFLYLQKLLIGPDRVEFQLDFLDASIERFIANGMIGVKLYLMKENPDIDKMLPENRKNLNRMFIIHVIFLLAVSTLIIWILFKLNIVSAVVVKARSFLSNYIL